MQTECPKCGTLNPLSASYCNECGASLEAGKVMQEVARSPREITYHSDESVLVTSTRAMLGGKTYAMANITSVSMGAKAVSRWWIVLAGLGVFVALSLAGGSLFNWVLLLPIAGVLALGVGILLAVTVKKKHRYTVRIGSASGEADALTSTDKAYIEGIVRAMNQAIIERG